MVIVLSCLAGFLTYAAFAPISLWWCAPLGIALIIHLLANPRGSQRLLAVVLFAAAFFGPLLSWSKTYVGDGPWLLLTVLQVTLTIPLAFIQMKKKRNLFLFPSLWVSVEFVRAHFPFGGFGWGRAAFSQSDAPYAQWARLGGGPLLSFLVTVIALAIVFIVRGQLKLGLLIFASIVFVTYFVNASDPLPLKPTFSVLAVQGGVPKLGLDFNSRATAVFENHLLLTRSFLNSHKRAPDVIVWPENAIDVDPFRNLLVRTELQSLADEFRTPLIVGAVLQSGGRFQNASILWEPIVGPRSIYIKRHLTPFGEYIPLRKIAEIISPYAKNVVDFIPGRQIIVHKVGRARFAPIICFELLDDASGRALSKVSNAIVVQTNSATFGLSPESRQQLGITRIRSIEHQRYSVSVSTSGISAVVDPRGQVTQETRLNRPAVIAAQIGLYNSLSVADRYGSQIEVFLLIFPFLLLRLGLRLFPRRRTSL